MRISLTSPLALRVASAPGPLVVEAPDATRGYEPLDMLASALGTCTHAILASWGEREGLRAEALAVDVAWTVVDHRAASYAVTIDWPALAPGRARVAERVAATCPVHRTLAAAVPITVAVAGVREAAA